MISDVLYYILYIPSYLCCTYCIVICIFQAQYWRTKVEKCWVCVESKAWTYHRAHIQRAAAATRRQSSTWDQIRSQQTDTNTPHCNMMSSMITSDTANSEYAMAYLQSVCVCTASCCCCVPAAPLHSRCTRSQCRCSVRRCRRAEGGHQWSRCIPLGLRNSPCSSTKLEERAAEEFILHWPFFYFLFLFVLNPAL